MAKRLRSVSSAALCQVKRSLKAQASRGSVSTLSMPRMCVIVE
ncbi:MAG: hypothetical protein U0793_21580 [Gemmataceae bacterium]